MNYIVDDWLRLYGESWKNEITPEAFTHPAKFSRALIRRIYQHCIDERWLSKGDDVLDCFGGVALGGLDAVRLGLNWTGVELEQRFVDLGNANIALWNKRYGKSFSTWGTARLLQGDSRNILSVIGEGVESIVTSPPYIDSMEHRGGIDSGKSQHTGGPNSQMNRSDTRYGTTDGQLGSAAEGDFHQVISSPPFQGQSSDGGWQMLGKYAEQGKLTVGQVNGDPNKLYPSWSKERDTSYGHSDGQMADMQNGNFEQVISSPPFLQTSGGTNVTSTEGPLRDARLIERHAAGNAAAGYGEAEGLSDLREGNFEQIVSSPPYGNITDTGGKDGLAFYGTGLTRGQPSFAPYSGSPENLGNAGDTFWSASKLIVSQCYAALSPNGHACWIVKDFVRKGERVPFCDMWRQLCESVGFVTLHEHRCWVVDDKGTQMAMDGKDRRYVTEKKSFFRRLAEKKGSPRIDFEVVICMVKP